MEETIERTINGANGGFFVWSGGDALRCNRGQTFDRGKQVRKRFEQVRLSDLDQPTGENDAVCRGSRGGRDVENSYIVGRRVHEEGPFENGAAS